MRKAGSIVLDRLRERILLGRYFGCWAPGDRLPSVRDVARLENIDRKTAAAAYRRLEREGLVAVEPRSGVYLRAEEREDGSDPLRRVHRQWLEHTLMAAAELGLDSSSVMRMLQAVGAIEARRIPVVDQDGDHAGLLARELAHRTGLDCAACRPADVPAREGPLRQAPFLVATPSVTARLKPVQRRLPVISATLAPELLGELGRLAWEGAVAVVVGTDGLARELTQALERGLVGPRERIRVTQPHTPCDVDGIGRDGERVVVWPGAPEWAASRLDGDAQYRPHLLADETLREVRRQVARSALDVVSRSSVAVPR